LEEKSTLSQYGRPATKVAIQDFANDALVVGYFWQMPSLTGLT
jgi:hypothetical protein